MSILSSEELRALSKEKLLKYLHDYCQESLQTSIRKTQASENLTNPSWPIEQAVEIGSQRTLNKLLNIIK